MVESQGLAAISGDVGGGSDQELVDQARASRREACETLARRHRQAAYLLALQMLGTRDDAMDVAQDAMLRFFISLRVSTSIIMGGSAELLTCGTAVVLEDDGDETA